MQTTVQSQLHDFFSKYPTWAAEADETIIQAGDEPQTVYFQTEGLVKQSMASKDGQEMVVTIYKPDTFWPLTWAINNIPNRHEFVAITACKGFKAPAQDVIAFLKEKPEVLWDLTYRLLSGINGMTTRMEYMMLGNAETRVWQALYSLGLRFANQPEHIISRSSTTVDLQLPLKLTQKELAHLTGLTRETVARSLTTLKKKTKVKRSRGHYLITLNLVAPLLPL